MILRDLQYMVKYHQWPSKLQRDFMSGDAVRQARVRAVSDAIIAEMALDSIVEMLRDPDWSAGMLEDIADIVRDTGRVVENYPDDRATWKRH